MDKLRVFLNMDELNWSNLGRTDLLAVDHQTNTPELLFEKIEDDVIERQVNKLLATKKANEAANAAVEPAKDNCTYDDFQKMDIRTGTIIEAEKVAKTKKLLKLTIDTGIDKRTVVSGIAEYYNPEEIIGQQVSILVNLEPRELKGIMSQGMILMAQDADGSLKFVTPTTPVKNGSEIK
jgi:methionyl-tRNA synthetase